MISEYGTRNHGDLQIPKVRLEYAKRCFYFSGVKKWNNIPGNIRERPLARREDLLNRRKHNPLVEQHLFSFAFLLFRPSIAIKYIILLKGPVPV